MSRAFRDAATQRLQTLGRPVVGGGLPCDESCHTLETLNLATMEWELTPALPGCRCDAACADLREEGGGWRLVLAGGDTLAESDSAELRGWSVTKVGPKLRLPAALQGALNNPNFASKPRNPVSTPASRASGLSGSGLITLRAL